MTVDSPPMAVSSSVGHTILTVDSSAWCRPWFPIARPPTIFCVDSVISAPLVDCLRIDGTDGQSVTQLLERSRPHLAGYGLLGIAAAGLIGAAQNGRLPTLGRARILPCPLHLRSASKPHS